MHEGIDFDLPPFTIRRPSSRLPEAPSALEWEMRYKLLAANVTQEQLDRVEAFVFKMLTAAKEAPILAADFMAAVIRLAQLEDMDRIGKLRPLSIEPLPVTSSTESLGIKRKATKPRRRVRHHPSKRTS